MPSGKVKWFDADKGFGFLSQDDGPDVYLHADALPDGMTTIKNGTRVEFGIAQGRRGDQALQVRVIDAPASVTRNKRNSQRKDPDLMVDDRRGRHPPARQRRRDLPPRPAPGAQDGGTHGQAAARAGRRARALTSGTMSPPECPTGSSSAATRSRAGNDHFSFLAATFARALICVLETAASSITATWAIRLPSRITTEAE